MCRFLFVSFALVPFSFCFSLLAFGEGCAELDDLNPNPLSSFKSTTICLIPTCWPRRMDLRGMMEICQGWDSLLCCFLHTGVNFPLADTVGNGMILSWFGMSQVLWVRFWDIFCVLLILCCFHVG